MNIVLLGPPGAGKGTQAKLIASLLKLDHLSSGDLLREAVREESSLGKKVKEYMDRGSLVPDELVIGLIKERVTKKGTGKGFLLDGFPRTLGQAKALKEMLLEIRKTIRYAVNIDVSDEMVLKRLAGRRTCSRCAAPFNTFFKPPRLEDVCDLCGGELIQRDDDTIGTIRQRLETYKKTFEPVLLFYKREGILKDIDGDRDIDEVWRDIAKVLKR